MAGQRETVNGGNLAVNGFMRFKGFIWFKGFKR